MDLAWNSRPPEEAAYFNPAFCGELLGRSTRDYTKLRGTPLPFALGFLILPLILHPASRRALPHKANTTFETWCADNHELLVTIPERVLLLRSVTREALLFMAQIKALDVKHDGIGLGPNPIHLPAKPRHSTPEVEEIRRRAGLVGRWFASQPAVPPILQAMGITL
jgi:hypothetical protein